MEIKWSFHTLCRIKERGITKNEIIETLTNPQKSAEQSTTKTAMRLRKNGHLLIVIYHENQNIKKIITVIDTSKVQKYFS